MEATIGGTRRHLVDVSRGLCGRGVEVHVAVATLRDPGFPADLAALAAEGVRVHTLQMVREVSPWKDWCAYRKLKQLMLDVQPDIVHTHSSKAGVLGRLASQATGIGQRIHTPHTFAFLFEALFAPWKRRIYQGVERRLAARTARMIAVSPSEARTMVDSGVVPSAQVRVVPNGLDATRVQGSDPVKLRKLGLDPQLLTAAVVGLLYEGKGQDLALRALCEPGCESLQLLIVGPGSQGALDDLARSLGVADRVVILGPRDDVPSLLAAVDLLLLPSRWEGMPYIVLEAMAAGLPVVATPVDGARDLVVPGKTGFLVDEVSEGALGRGLAQVLDAGPEGRAGMGQSGAVRVRDEFGLEPMIDALQAVYQEVL